MDVRALVGLNVQRLRRERQFSQEELAFRSGATRAYLSGVEAGRRNATILTLDKLAKALEADIGEFFLKPSRRPANKKPTAKRLKSRPHVVDKA
jgi:Predicted transcriptional regulator with C-terminal CBS domains